ncbi:MAG: sensor histidine kinase, partial [Anaerovoracaceae bacterium]
IGQLAGGMAHQIRNPLGIIRTQSFIIRNSHRDDTALNKSLDYVDDSVKRASEIIDNVMNFWRVSDDTQTEIPVRQLLESVVLLQEKDFVSSEIQVEIDCNPALLLVSSADALKHILHNLVANSVDAMEHGGRLTLRGRKDGNFVELTCEDTGCGISEKNRSNLFNPFFTTKEPGKGTGLGLFIVYSEVEKLGGTIEVTSREGEGTTFLIRVPQGQV